MGDRKLFSQDPFTGVTKYFHWDDSNDTFLIETEMAAPILEDIVEDNKQSYNDAPSNWGNGQLVATIPIHIYWDLKKKGIADDDAAMRRWLNDPDNRFFRRRPGTV
jgi:hypothetical protein